MAAKDYVFVEGIFGNIYLAKKTKTPNLMSQDRRIATGNEIIGMFENYLRRRCKKLKSNEISIMDKNGKEIFSAKLNLDKK